MKEFLDKISSYNIFNYLFPGILFAVILPHLSPYSLVQDSIVLGVFVYYFIGLVISRLGSLIIEPILKKIRFLVFLDYRDFVAAEKADPKIELFSEVNNTYRSLVAMIVSLLIVRAYYLFSLQLTFFNFHQPVVILSAL